MTKSQIKQLSHEELFALSLKRGSLNCYTQEALYAQELLYTEMFLPHEVINENQLKSVSKYIIGKLISYAITKPI